MNQILINIVEELELLANAVTAIGNDSRPISIAHNNWQFPSVTLIEIAEEAKSLSFLIELKGDLISDDDAKHFESTPEKLSFLRINTVPHIWTSPLVAVPAYLSTLLMIRNSLENNFQIDVNQSDLSQAIVTLNSVRQRLRGLEISLNEIEPKKVSIETMVNRIEQAHSTADQLPTDLEDLNLKRNEMAELLKHATADLNRIVGFELEAGKVVGEIKGTNIKISDALNLANVALVNCESALAASTNVGLGAAFSERSKALLLSIRFWVTGLIVALFAGGYFGINRVNSMAYLLNDPQISTGVIFFNLLLTFLSVGGSVWFAWLSTRQVGQRFKLAEDYAFKASISRAYEGYRKEASRIDPALEAKLLRSALDRLDEQPIRFVEHSNHASPLHEMLNSEVIKNAINLIPNFATAVQTFAKDSLASLKPASKTISDSVNDSPSK